MDIRIDIRVGFHTDTFSLFHQFIQGSRRLKGRRTFRKIRLSPRSLDLLRQTILELITLVYERYEAVGDRSVLDAVLEKSGCLPFIAAA